MGRMAAAVGAGAATRRCQRFFQGISKSCIGPLLRTEIVTVASARRIDAAANRSTPLRLRPSPELSRPPCTVEQHQDAKFRHVGDMKQHTPAPAPEERRTRRKLHALERDAPRGSSPRALNALSRQSPANAPTRCGLALHTLSGTRSGSEAVAMSRPCSDTSHKGRWF